MTIECCSKLDLRDLHHKSTLLLDFFYTIQSESLAGCVGIFLQQTGLKAIHDKYVTSRSWIIQMVQLQYYRIKFDFLSVDNPYHPHL